MVQPSTNMQLFLKIDNKIKSKYSLKKVAVWLLCHNLLDLVFNKLKLKTKDKLLIVGIGGLGQVLIQGSKILNLNLYAVDVISMP